MRYHERSNIFKGADALRCSRCVYVERHKGRLANLIDEGVGFERTENDELKLLVNHWTGRRKLSEWLVLDIY